MYSVETGGESDLLSVDIDVIMCSLAIQVGDFIDFNLL